MTNIRQHLANLSGHSVRDMDYSSLANLYGSKVAEMDREDVENELARERQASVDERHIDWMRRQISAAIETERAEVDAVLPIISVFEAYQSAKASAKKASRDMGLRNLELVLEKKWKADKEASLTVNDTLRLKDHYKRNFPKSAAMKTIESFSKSGYMALPVSDLMQIAGQIRDQKSYVRAIKASGLDSNTPYNKKARAFILACVNGESGFEVEAQAALQMPYEETSGEFSQDEIQQLMENFDEQTLDSLSDEDLQGLLDSLNEVGGMTAKRLAGMVKRAMRVRRNAQSHEDFDEDDSAGVREDGLFEYTDQDVKKYWNAVGAFAQAIIEESEKTGQDIQELAQEYADSSEYTFKPRMQKIVLAESDMRYDTDSAAEAMVSDIMSAIKQMHFNEHGTGFRQLESAKKRAQSNRLEMDWGDDAWMMDAENEKYSNPPKWDMKKVDKLLSDLRKYDPDAYQQVTFGSFSFPPSYVQEDPSSDWWFENQEMLDEMQAEVDYMKQEATPRNAQSSKRAQQMDLPFFGRDEDWDHEADHPSNPTPMNPLHLEQPPDDRGRHPKYKHLVMAEWEPHAGSYLVRFREHGDNILMSSDDVMSMIDDPRQFEEGFGYVSDEYLDLLPIEDEDAE